MQIADTAMVTNESSRFRRVRSTSRRRLTIACAFVVLVLAACLVTAPVTLLWYDVQSLGSAIRHSPAISPAVSTDTYMAELDPSVDGSTVRLIARVLAHAASWFGHDALGRSMLFRLLPGTLVSLLIGIATACISMIVGTACGTLAGWYGGRTDQLLMRIVDVLYGLPYILTVILLRVALQPVLSTFLGGRTQYASILLMIIAVSGVSWLTIARVVRGQVLSLKEQPFVEAARAAGAKSPFIIRRHLLPHLWGSVVVYATLVVPQAILQESFLSFLGIGVQQPAPSLGRLAADGLQAINPHVGFWWMLFFPCAALSALLLALNIMGDALRDSLDPRSARPSWI